jgi:hypothetical protein
MRTFAAIAIAALVATSSTCIASGHAKKPTPTRLKHLGKLAAGGSQAAVDEIAAAAEVLYADIDYTKDPQRVISNLALMRLAFDPIAEKAGEGSPAAMESLVYANGKQALHSFTVAAFGQAAATGNKEALNRLVNYKENGWLLSSVVIALQGAAEKNIPEAVDFLVEVMDDPSAKSLWVEASQGLAGAASRGNERAKTALKKYGKTKP